MIDTRVPNRTSKTFSRIYVAPALRKHLDTGGEITEWPAGRSPIASMARISADRLEGDAVGVDRQRRNNTRNAEIHNYVVVMHGEDNNVSATEPEAKRPVFEQILKDVTHGHEEETRIPIRGCIATERDRAYRLARDFLSPGRLDHGRGQHFHRGRGHHGPCRGKLSTLRKQREEIKESVAEGHSLWAAAQDVLVRMNRNMETLEKEEQERLAAEAKRNLLRGWRYETWNRLDLAAKRAAGGQVLASVIVLPVPKGVSDKAPFDPALLKVYWQRQDGS
ncbi:hypothetical protein [Streptomyces sp. CA-132043]|uniref:hypothetical protein n=1 Tax=Streptomyces sp. CA-132043 TaxID=3240048 RepID=UPI003D8F20E1